MSGRPTEAFTQYYDFAAGPVWQPIETAPKDGGDEDGEGPIILLATYTNFSPEDFHACCYIGFWGQQSGWTDDSPYQWCDWGASHDIDGWQEIINPTHWMPLPKAPR